MKDNMHMGLDLGTIEEYTRLKVPKLKCPQCNTTYFVEQKNCPWCGRKNTRVIEDANGMPMRIRRCRLCEKRFFGGENECPSCLGKEEAREEANPKAIIKMLKGEVAYFKAAVEAMSQQIIELKEDQRNRLREMRYLRDEIKRKDDELKRLSQKEQPKTQNINMGLDTITKLISLCHPDKHGGSTTANEVTVWLLEERRKRK